MANIQWTSSAIQSYFNTSLNRKDSSGLNNMYQLLNDAALIKSGSYHKLVDSYYAELKKTASSSSTAAKTDKEDSSKTETSKTETSKTETSKTETSKAETSDTTTNAGSKYASYNSTGVKTQSVESILDKLI